MNDLIQRMDIATVELTADNFHTEAKVMADAANEIAALRSQRDRLLAALDPNETKADYIGEVKDDVVMLEDDGYGTYQEVSRKHTISWTAIKDIMALIRKRAGVE